ncbi:hypothetical protein [Gimesia maris]|uniref:hypothetical protein n=1 Tax=Gimesia maris TaxID=122 RepID=UPI0030D86B5E
MSNIWYHLSSAPNLKTVAHSSIDRDGTINPRKPDKSHDEPNIPRVCLASKVWQCLAGIPKNGKLHIYELETDLPIKAHGTAGDANVDEYWLTDDQLKSEIPLLYRGFINLNNELYLAITCLSNVENPKYGILNNPDCWNITDDGEWLFFQEYSK